MNEVNVKIKRLNANAVIPQYAKQGDSGFDLVAVEDTIVEPGETVRVSTGLAFEIPEGYEMQIRPRSGITSKTKLRVQLGTIDAGYRGEVAVLVDNIAPKRLPHFSHYDGLGVDLNGKEVEVGPKIPYGYTYIQKGDRIAQAVIAPVSQAQFTEVDELGESERGEGGFGSSGVNSYE